MALEAPQWRVPPEITDMIIRILRDDREALNNCSLVAKNWLPSARCYLLARVVLHPTNVDSFIDLSASPRCTLGHYLRQLVLTLDPSTGPRALHHFAGLSSVTTLRISRNAKWLGKVNEAAPGYFPSLTRLEIDGVQFESFANLIHLICAFPALRCLWLRDTTWSRSEQLVINCSLPPTLCVIDIETSRKWDILDWMVANNVAFTPKSVNLGTVASAQVGTISKYVRRWGPSLEMLGFGMMGLDPGRDAAEFHAAGDLKLCTSIRLIRIQHFIFYDNRYRQSSAVTWYHRILDQTNSRHLAEIQFVVFLDNQKQLDPENFPINWAAYDQVFARSPRFTQLNRVVFAVYGSIAAELAEKEIKRRLPLCDALGILCCAYFGFDSLPPLASI